MWCYTLLPKILNMSLTAGIVIVLVLLARIPLKRAPKIFSYALWAVVLFRLVCPVSFSSEFSLLSLFHAPVAINGSVTYIPADIVHTEYPQVDLPLPGVSEVINDSLPQGKEQLVADPLEWPMAAATMFWFFGIAAMLIYSGISLLLLRRRLIGAVRLRDNIYLADHISMPFVIGVIHPKIYLPSTLTEQEQSYIILHEQTHIRRYDHIFKMLAFLALTVHWFNPLVWVAFVCCVKDMEMSCDERVLKELGEEIKGAYSTSLLSLAIGRSIINGSPLAFGEGDIKGRIKNILNFKKPAVWVIAISVMLVVALSVGLTVNRAVPDNSSDWEVYEFPSYLYDRVMLTSESEVYPSSFEVINVTLKNMEMESGLQCSKAFTLVKKFNEEWRIVPLVDNEPAHVSDLSVGESETYTLTPDMLSVELEPGNYRIVTEVWYASEQPPQIVRTVWVDFTIAAPDSAAEDSSSEATRLDPTSPKLSPGQSIGVDMVHLDYASDDIVIFHDYFGLFVYDLNSRQIVRSLDLNPIGCTATQGDDYCQVTVSSDGNTVQLHPMSSETMYIYNVSENTLIETVFERMENRFAGFIDIVDALGNPKVGNYSHQAVKFETGEYGYLHTSDWTLSTLSYVRGGDMMYSLFEFDSSVEEWQLISRADVNWDNRDEDIYLDKSQIDERLVTLRIINELVIELWSEQLSTSHAGWGSLFLCELDGKEYLLRYNPGMWQGYCTYTYTLFTLEGGVEKAYQTKTLEFDINGTKALDVPEMVAFADEVNALIEKSILLLNTDGGDFHFGPSTAEVFFERYSWLDNYPELFKDGDSLETRLNKYSEYAVSNYRRYN